MRKAASRRKDIGWLAVMRATVLRDINLFKLNYVRGGSYYYLLFNRLYDLLNYKENVVKEDTPSIVLKNLNVVRLIIRRIASVAVYEEAKNEAKNEVDYEERVEEYDEKQREKAKRYIVQARKNFIGERLLFNVLREISMEGNCGTIDEFGRTISGIVRALNSYVERIKYKIIKYHLFESIDVEGGRGLFTRMYMNFNRNNVYFTVSNNVGRPYYSYSTGVCGARGKDKTNMYHVYWLSVKIFKRLAEMKRRDKSIFFFISGLVSEEPLDMIFSNLTRFKLRAGYIKIYTPLPFSKGLRERKPRRI